MTRVVSKCPVCEGKGHVPAGFYESVGTYIWSSTSTNAEMCRSCEGKGIVWSPEPTMFPRNQSHGYTSQTTFIDFRGEKDGKDET